MTALDFRQSCGHVSALKSEAKCINRMRGAGGRPLFQVIARDRTCKNFVAEEARGIVLA